MISRFGEMEKGKNIQNSVSFYIETKVSEIAVCPKIGRFLQVLWQHIVSKK